jgi:hypothetical protein
MPVVLILLLVDIPLVYHACKTGRARPWAFIILMVPLVGSLAYICVELVPEWFSSPGARQARQRIANRLDPDKRYRELPDPLADGDTIANRTALAAECLNVARFDEAERHYDHVLTLPMGDDPKFALGKAQAQFAAKRPGDALATLDDLQKRWPDFESAEGHLLYARSPAEVGRLDEAFEEYHGLGLFPWRRGEGSLRAVAAHGRSHRGSQDLVQRITAADEACAEIPARRAGPVARDRREAALSLSGRVAASA